MPSLKIMPCLDIREGRVVKGVHFVDIKDAGDPVLAARSYIADGADELAFLDINATWEQRSTSLHVVQNVAAVVTVPFTVGGGIKSVADARKVLAAGATRVSVSSAAFRRPELVNELAAEFGSDKVVVAIDVDRSRATPSGYEVYVDGGRTATGADAIAWAKDAEKRGAGIILPTSKACDGVKQGYDIPLITRLKEAVGLPIVASGGAGTLEHFAEAAAAGADILLAASVFHFGTIRVSQLKAYLAAQGYSVN